MITGRKTACVSLETSAGTAGRRSRASTKGCHREQLGLGPQVRCRCDHGVGSRTEERCHISILQLQLSLCFQVFPWLQLTAVRSRLASVFWVQDGFQKGYLYWYHSKSPFIDQADQTTPYHFETKVETIPRKSWKASKTDLNIICERKVVLLQDYHHNLDAVHCTRIKREFDRWAFASGTPRWLEQASLSA